MKLYGLIGKTLKHSFSKKYFDKKFNSSGLINHQYQLFELENIDHFPELLQRNHKLVGLNVTIPYKESVIKYLDELDDFAKDINAVNTITINHETQRLKGYNTDVYGFEYSLKKNMGHNIQMALVLGSGGASKAVCYVLNKLGIDYNTISRKEYENYISYGNLDPELVKNSSLIINCTPVGMYPDNQSIPQIPIDAISENHIIFDLIYNPEETRLMEEGRKRGAKCVNGYEMLIHQAEKSWQIWNSKEKFKCPGNK